MPELPAPGSAEPVRDTLDSSSPARIATALFLLSTATVLFTLATFKLLSFFIMPSLFFDLLFVGFPVGAFLGARFFRKDSAAFRRTLWILQLAMIFSIGAALACKHFDYLRAHLFEVRLSRLLVQMGTFTAFFVPFFCAYGLSEYLGYQVGRERLKGRMSWVYALYLFGAAFAYLTIQWSLSSLGVSRILCISIALITFSHALISSRGVARTVLSVETLALVAILFVPGFIEQGFLEQYKGRGAQSTHEYANVKRPPFVLAFQEWGDYSLTEVMYSPERDEFAGFYNDLMQWEYAPKYGFTSRSLGMIPIQFAPKGGKIAIVGAGGGRQVRWALNPSFAFREIVAIELEPAVFRAIRGSLREDFGEVYEQPTVTPVRHEARSYMEGDDLARREHEKTDGPFDLIYLPSVGGYPQMMLEPGNMIRTIDAYRTLRDRLSEHGVLAVWYPSGLDPKAILTTQYARTLSSENVGMTVKIYTNPEEFLILATRDASTPLPSHEEVDDFLLRVGPSAPDLRPEPSARSYPFFALADPGYRPISDDQPFLAGNVRHIFGIEQLYALFGIVFGALLVLGTIIILVLRRSGDPRIPGRSYAQVVLISLLVGANFLIFEHYLILALFKRVYVFHDALVLGAVSFLILSGLGSILITRRNLAIFQGVGVLCVVALLFLQPHLPPLATIALAAPIALVTGSFFPALFELASRNPLAVFACDALGAGVGSMLAFFVPIAFGFRVFFPVAAVVFLLTVLASWLFFRSSRAPVNAALEAGEAPHAANSTPGSP